MELVFVVFAVFSAGMCEAADASPVVTASPVAPVAALRTMKSRLEDRFRIRLKCISSHFSQFERIYRPDFKQ